jgi:4-hydroxythreonine-4-phosphate dehydrogenase
MSRAPVIAVTSGEPAGIGPEICLRLADCSLDARFPARIVVSGGSLAARRAGGGIALSRHTA